MKIIKMKIADLIHDPANARKHDDKNLSAIKGSLAAFGQQKPIVIDEKNVVLAGNGTLEAAKSLGWTEIGCVVTDLKTSTDKKAFALADNRTSELASWDTDILSDALKGLTLDDFDITSIGFDLPGLDTPPEGLTDPDDVPADVDTRAKPGDIWKLGNHRVMCGDSTNIQHVDLLMNGDKADMVFTDPPYNITNHAQKTNNSVLKKFIDQSKAIEHIAQFNPDEFTQTLPVVLKEGIVNAYFFCNKDLVFDYIKWGREVGAPENILVWKKPAGMIAHRHYGYDVEYIVYLRLNAIFNNKIEGANYSRVQEYGRTGKLEKGEGNDHPTVKPVALLSNILTISSNVSSLVYDAFLGSGSTLLACEKTNRKCYGMEIDPKYVDVILARWEKFTGKTAALAEDLT